MDKFSLIIPSSRPEMAKLTQASLGDIPHEVFDGIGCASFSKLINTCIVHAKEEIVIIASDKTRPNLALIKKMLDMLNEGWGLVGLYRFAFFGFKKDLIRKIGFFDERFISGGYEDADMVRRLSLNNISYFESEECPYMNGRKSSWNGEQAFIHFNNKGKMENDVLIKKIKEENYDYDIGGYQGSQFLPWESNCKLLGLSGNFRFQKIIDES